jgi:rRNA-processing protein FCF1
MNEYDIFVNNKIYPNASDIFKTDLESMSEVKDKCLFIIDTNALLLPYTTSSKSIDEVKKVYQKLIDENRLFIPGQVAREFANNRSTKIKELYQQLNRKKSKLNRLFEGQYPLLSDITEYKEAIEKEKKIDGLVKDYSHAITSVMKQIKNWNWTDPVSITYNSLFSDSVIFDPIFDESDIKKKLQYRYNHKIPPGYKDGGKEDDGIGDLIIWLTILELAKKHSQDIVFVSGEEKSDWYCKSEGQALYPRYELIAEFRENSNKKSFNMIKLSELLELFGADDKIVKELEFEEKTLQINTRTNFLEKRQFSEMATRNWIISNYGDSSSVSFEREGFADMVIHSLDNIKTAVKVIMTINNSQMAIIRFRDYFTRAYYEVNEKLFDKYLFIIIYGSDTPMETVISNQERIAMKYNSDNIDFEIISGYINDNNKLEVVGFS